MGYPRVVYEAGNDRWEPTDNELFLLFVPGKRTPGPPWGTRDSQVF